MTATATPTTATAAPAPDLRALQLREAQRRALPAAVDPLLRMPQVEAAVGLKRSTIYLLISQDKFPAGVLLSARARAWRASEIEAWAAGRVAAGGVSSGIGGACH